MFRSDRQLDVVQSSVSTLFFASDAIAAFHSSARFRARRSARCSALMGSSRRRAARPAARPGARAAARQAQDGEACVRRPSRALGRTAHWGTSR